MFEQADLRVVRKKQRTSRAVLVVVAVVGTLAAVAGWTAWQSHRERLILGCEAKTLTELRSALGSPDAAFQVGKATCWRYTWAWGESTWCSPDGRAAGQSSSWIW